MYVTSQRRRRRWLGSGASSSWATDIGYQNQDPSVGLVTSGNPDAITASLPDPAACSWWDDIWPSQACVLARGQQQIQSVPINAANANAAAVGAGLAPPYNIPLIQGVANTQTAAFGKDVAAIYAVPPPLPFSIPWYVWAIGGALGLLLLANAVKR